MAYYNIATKETSWTHPQSQFVRCYRHRDPNSSTGEGEWLPMFDPSTGEVYAEMKLPEGPTPEQLVQYGE